MSVAAADHAAGLLRETIARKGRARLVAATGASQIEFLAALVAAPGIEWNKVDLFHLDEYVGLPITHPASFRRYLHDRLIDVVGIRSYHLLDGESDCRRVAADAGRALTAAPIDLAFVGIGENGHLAFNDPPADFDTSEPYLVVTLDDACRRQQVGEGWFASLDEVPEQAISMSVRQILESRIILCVVPDARKAAAVKACVEGPVSPLAPASILQLHAATTLYLDRDSSELLRPSTRGAHRWRRTTSREARMSGPLRSAGQRLRRRRFQRARPVAPIAWRFALAQLRLTGVTRCLPTLITSSFDDFAACARVLADVDGSGDRRHPHGGAVHLAGGRRARRASARLTSPRHVVTTSSAGRRRRDGRIVLVTLAPEVPRRIALIEQLVTPACASPSATRRDRRSDRRRRLCRRDAVDAPRQRLRAMLPRHPNVIWEQLAADGLLASLIVDGHHLPPATVKAMVRAKGADRTILVTDAIGAAGSRARPLPDRRRRVRARRRRPRVASRDAVPRRLEPDARSRDREHRPVHRPADRRTSSDGVARPRRATSASSRPAR